MSLYHMGINSYKHYITSNSGLNTPNSPLRLFKAVKNMLGAGKKLHWSGDGL